MDSETNILVRQILAGALFTLGIVWAVVLGGGLLTVFVGPTPTVGLILFLVPGFAIWASWGLIAFTNLKRKKELTAWYFSAFFHLSMLVFLVAVSGGSRNLGALAVIPIWWAIALATSLVSLVLILRSDEEKA